MDGENLTIQFRRCAWFCKSITSWHLDELDGLSCLLVSLIEFLSDSQAKQFLNKKKHQKILVEKPTKSNLEYVNMKHNDDEYMKPFQLCRLISSPNSNPIQCENP